MCRNFAVGSSAGNRILSGVLAAALGMENAGVPALAAVVKRVDFYHFCYHAGQTP